MCQWQPIETAPKDGRSVLLWVVKDGYALFALCEWSVTAINPDGSWCEVTGGDSAGTKPAGGNPTHWMLLHPPPIT